MYRRCVKVTVDTTFLQLVAEIKEAKKELKKAQTIMQMEELKCRKRVLRRLLSVQSDEWSIVWAVNASCLLCVTGLSVTQCVLANSSLQCMTVCVPCMSDVLQSRGVLSSICNSPQTRLC